MFRGTKRTFRIPRSAWVALFVLWALCVVTGMRLPFIYTGAVDKFRWFIVLPLLLLPTLFVVLRRTSGGKSALQLYLASKPDRRARVREGLLLVIGLAFIPWGLAWTSAAYVAWATKALATTAYSEKFQITNVERRSGARWSTLFELSLHSSSGEESRLIFTRSSYEKFRWKRGEAVCLKGRTWTLGTIVTDATRSMDEC